MQYRPIGKSGINASVVGLGTWAIGGWMWGGTEANDSIRAIHAAIEAGINLIDTAPAYGFGLSEEIVGRAIQGRRDRVVLATKCGLVWHTQLGEHYFDSDESHPQPGATKYRVYRCLRPEVIRYEVEQSLRRLHVDHLDVYQTHWQDSTTPIADTMAELLKLKTEGKIRAIGCCNASVRELGEYRAAGQLDVDQENYSMLDRKHETGNLPYCADHGLAFFAYSPLALGLLTGKIGFDRKFNQGDLRRERPWYSAENRTRVKTMLDQIKPIADSHGVTLAQLVIAWTVAQRGCTHALVGARNPIQARENARAGAVQLPAAELATIGEAINAGGLAAP